MIPVNLPYSFYNVKKKYEVEHNKNTPFYAKEHILGKRFIFGVSKNNTEFSTFMFFRGRLFLVKNIASHKGLDNYMSFVGDQPKTFLLVLMYIQNLVDKSIYIDNAQINTVFCGVHERGRNKKETEFEMIIENVLFNGRLLYGKQFYSLMNLIEMDLCRQENNICNFYTPLIKIDTFDNLCSMNIDMQSGVSNKNNIKIHGVSLITETESEILPIIKLLEIPAALKESKNKKFVDKFTNLIHKDIIEKNTIKFLPIQRNLEILNIVKKTTQSIIKETITKSPELLIEFETLTIGEKERLTKQIASYIGKELYKVLKEQKEREDNVYL